MVVALNVPKLRVSRAYHANIRPNHSTGDNRFRVFTGGLLLYEEGQQATTEEEDVANGVVADYCRVRSGVFGN